MKGHKNIVVIGDLIVDVFHHGTWAGRSLSHSKTDVLRAGRTDVRWGGAGCVAKHLVALGAHTTFITVAGRDEPMVRAAAGSHAQLKTVFIAAPDRQVPVKERFFIAGERTFNWYRYDNKPLSRSHADAVHAALGRALRNAHAVVAADYRHGMISKALARRIVRSCARAGVPLFVDSQLSAASPHTSHRYYKGAQVFCLNIEEARAVERSFDPRDPLSGLTRMKKSLTAQEVVVKLGSRGSVALVGNDLIRTSGVKARAVDTIGAGDAFIAALALGQYPSRPEDLKRANAWAARSTTVIGTSVPSRRI